MYWRTILDLVLVYMIVYYILLWAKMTHAFNLIRGILVLLLFYYLSWYFGLTTLHWVLERFAAVLILVVIIVLQPEMRRMLGRIGRRSDLFMSLTPSKGHRNPTVIKHILTAVDTLSKHRVGALIVLEMNRDLSDYVDSGIKIHGDISSDLLINLFWPGAPMHDGAVIIRDDKVLAAGCLLPLTENPLPDRRLATRHRAALGMAELSDAVVLVVSEETGYISIAEGGNLTRFLNREALEARLFDLYREENLKSGKSAGFWGTLRSWMQSLGPK